MAGDRDKPEETASDLFVDPLGGLSEGNAEEGAVDLPIAEADPVDLSSELGLSLEAPEGELTSIPLAPRGTETVVLAESPGDSESITSDVNNLIDRALPGTIPEAPPAELGSGGDRAARFFELTIRGLGDARASASAAAILRKFPAQAEAEGLEARLRDLGAYRATRLGEFHAYALAVYLQRAGLEFQLAMPGFGREDELPGIVSEILEIEKTASTGAVAVALPSKPGELLLSTLGSVPGYTAQTSKGVVTAHGAIARAFFREDEKNARLESKIQALQPGGKKGQLPRAEIDKVFQTLLERLQREAFRRGANGVIGIQIGGFSESSSFNPDADQIRLIASGTAVLLEPVK